MLFGIVSGICTLPPGDRNSVASGAVTYAEQPGMPIDVRSIAGLASVSERISAPQPVPAAMPPICHCTVVPSTGSSLAPSDSPLNAVEHSPNVAGTCADRSREPGSTVTPPGVQPVSTPNAAELTLCHTTLTVPFGK